MNNSSISIASSTIGHIKTTRENELIFDSFASEIVILDRLGKAIWKKSRGESMCPILWDGVDSFGCKVTSGSLLCKITYPDGQVIYVPFVFIQK